MKRSLSAVACLLALSALMGCETAKPSTAMLTYETVPLGATLYEGKESIGVAPVTRTYTADANGAVRTPEVTAVWPSGAKTTFWTNLKVGDDRVTKLDRPAGAPNLAVDEENGKKFAAEAAKEAARQRAATLKDQARSSPRCQAQQQGGPVAGIDDCN